MTSLRTLDRLLTGRPGTLVPGSGFGVPGSGLRIRDSRFGIRDSDDVASGFSRKKTGGKRWRWLVLDLVFVGVSVLFFVVSIGYVAACERLMK
jgi:hypothetical protein